MAYKVNLLGARNATLYKATIRVYVPPTYGRKV